MRARYWGAKKKTIPIMVFVRAKRATYEISKQLQVRYLQRPTAMEPWTFGAGGVVPVHRRYAHEWAAVPKNHGGCGRKGSGSLSQKSLFIKIYQDPVYAHLSALPVFVA